MTNTATLSTSDKNIINYDAGKKRLKNKTRERGREGERKRERERERESQCVCVCLRERERESQCVCVSERERERERWPGEWRKMAGNGGRAGGGKGRGSPRENWL